MQLTTRRNAAMALALSSSLHRSIPAAAFHAVAAFSQHNHRNAAVRHYHHRLKSSTSRDDSSLTRKATCYNHLKQSRPIRIKAKALHPSEAAATKAALLANNDDTSSSSTTPSTITKLVHFQRHGQGTHNQLYKEWTDRTGIPIDLSETIPELNPLLLPDIIDAPLTDKGRNQCIEQRIDKSKYLGGVELIVVSPLVRALETACITFHDHLPSTDNINGGEEGVVRWIAHEGIREELGLLLCNQRRPLKETRLEFPHVDFSLLTQNESESEEDVYWKQHCERTSMNNADDGTTPQRESMEDISHRAYDFLVEYLYHRPEREIAVVGHSAWLLAMTNAVLEFEGSGDAEDFGTMFGQAELRSATLTFTQAD
eukprot:scaffold10835_cov153-Skeletonema_menzelii.AAC.7